MGLVAVVVQGWLVGLLARRLPERALVVLGTAALGLGFLWIPFAGRAVGLPMGLLMALALVVGGQGLASPSLSSLISKTVEERSEEHTSELQSLAYLVCRLLLEKKKKTRQASFRS